MPITVITEPALEPVKLADLKNDLKVDADLTSDDFLIEAFTKAARRFVESKAGRSLITQTLELTLDTWPATAVIRVPGPPLQTVTSVKYYGTDDGELTLSSGLYFVDSASSPGRIVLNHGEGWPATTLRPANAVIVRFVAGYGDDEKDVPDHLTHAIRLLAGHWYENREAVATTGAVPKEIPFGVDALIWPDRVVPV